MKTKNGHHFMRNKDEGHGNVQQTAGMGQCPGGEVRTDWTANDDEEKKEFPENAVVILQMH
ncbi:hypothetical protein TYRP_009154 [Tyrophagus putrescentiae]|nr:hypothetical protein TYRP_009154 [Tyrophagus putrescentiae]